MACESRGSSGKRCESSSPVETRRSRPFPLSYFPATAGDAQLSLVIRCHLLISSTVMCLVIWFRAVGVCPPPSSLFPPREEKWETWTRLCLSFRRPPASATSHKLLRLFFFFWREGVEVGRGAQWIYINSKTKHFARGLWLFSEIMCIIRGFAHRLTYRLFCFNTLKTQIFLSQGLPGMKVISGTSVDFF